MARPSVSLAWNGLTLCNPSNGVDDYDLAADDVAQADVIEAVIPNTAGRLTIVKGIGQSDQTSTKLEFNCEAKFSDPGDYFSFRDSIQALVTSVRGRIGAVTYGMIGSEDSNSVNDCEMSYKLIGYMAVAANDFRVKFGVTFTKVSG